MLLASWKLYRIGPLPNEGTMPSKPIHDTSLHDKCERLGRLTDKAVITDDDVYQLSVAERHHIAMRLWDQCSEPARALLFNDSQGRVCGAAAESDASYRGVADRRLSND